MVLLNPGKSRCSLCKGIIEANQPLVTSSHFIADPNHLLYRFSDSAMHYECFQEWPLRAEFVAEYNRTVGSKVWGNGTRHVMREDGVVVTEVVRSGPVAYLWEYSVKPERFRDFERIYGPNGEWAQLFRRSPAYRGTTLLRDSAASARYLTLDHWDSEQAFLQFKASFAREYAELDQQCEPLTLDERMLGTYLDLPGGSTP